MFSPNYGLSLNYGQKFLIRLLISILLLKVQLSILSNTKLAYQEKIIEKTLIDELFQSEDTLNPIYYKEAQLIIKLVLERLPEQRRMIFEMSRFKHMSNLEIAEKLNISKRTVEHHIYLTLLEIKKIIFFAFFLLLP